MELLKHTFKLIDTYRVQTFCVFAWLHDFGSLINNLNAVGLLTTKFCFTQTLRLLSKIFCFTRIVWLLTCVVADLYILFYKYSVVVVKYLFYAYLMVAD